MASACPAPHSPALASHVMKGAVTIFAHVWPILPTLVPYSLLAFTRQEIIHKPVVNNERLTQGFKNVAHTCRRCSMSWFRQSTKHKAQSYWQNTSMRW